MKETITKIWNLIPRYLWRYIGIGLSSGIALAIVLALYLFWGSGYIQERLGLMVTKKDLKEQTDSLHHGSALMMNEVDAKIADYDQGIREYLERERRLAKDTILQPILRSLEVLDRNQRAIMRSQAATTERMEELPRAFDAKLERMLEATDPKTQHEQLKKVMEKLEKLESDNEQLREQLRGRRTTRQQM